ncbi:MAG: DUF6020 family protein [Oscillospiraceae bacterium]|nr:DUF6020 family protein [Oscillospiraceae bacterium]
MTLKNKIIDVIRTSMFRYIMIIFGSLISSAAFARFYGFTTANITTLLLAALMIPMFRAAMLVKNRKINCISIFIGLFFTLCNFMLKYEWLTFQENHVGLYIVEFMVGFWLFFTAMSAVLLDKLRDFRLNTPGKEPPLNKRLRFFFASAGIMFICWLPYFLMAYPGEVTSDSIHQLNQMIGNEPLSNHHPIAHTFVIKFFFSIGKAIFHDDNRAVATYSIAQMILLSFAFSYLLTTLYRLRVKKVVIGAVLVCYALLSYHGSYSMTIWKDIPFAAFVVCYSVTLWRILLHMQNDEKKLPLFEMVMLFIMGLGVCLFRSNGLYAYMLTTLFITVFCIRKRKWIMLGVSGAALVVALVVTGPVYSSLGIQKPEPLESLALPQQMIGAVLHNERLLTQDQIDLISNVADFQGIKEHYNPHSADGIKVYVWENGNEQYVAEHKSEFFKLWLDLGKKYPQDYIIAVVYQTLGYWFPDVQNWVYSGEFRNDNMELERVPKLSDETCKKLDDLRNKYSTFYFLGLFWSIGGVVWLAVFMMGATFTKQKLPMLLVFLPVMSVWGTLLIAAPVFAEFRYMYSFFSTVPLLCAVPFVTREGILSVDGASAESPVPSADAEQSVSDSADATAEPAQSAAKQK